MGIVEDESYVVFDDPQAFRGPVCFGVENAEDARLMHVGQLLIKRGLRTPGLMLQKEDSGAIENHVKSLVALFSQHHLTASGVLPCCSLKQGLEFRSFKGRRKTRNIFLTMRLARWITVVWPGLSQLWLAGAWWGLAIACGFAWLVNLVVVSTFVWTELITPWQRVGVWLLLVTVWTAATVLSVRQLRFSNPEAEQATAE